MWPFEGDLALDVFGGGKRWLQPLPPMLPMQEPILTDGPLLYLPDRNLLLSYLLITAGHD